MKDWSPQKSKELYGLDIWSQDYFDINELGHMEIKIKDKSLDLFQLAGELKERGLRLPLLLRFPGILEHRIELLSSCFSKAIEENAYKGNYRGVFPVKVNQQKHVVEDLVKLGDSHHLGLEAGSKPELLIALSKMKSSKHMIICNGFKDKEYIETAILSQKLNKNIVIVVDRKSELNLILEASKELKIEPQIGFRAKLSTKGSGRWMESSGHKSKFGLTPFEIIEGVNLLKENNMLHTLKLLHFHIGSQIPSILSIKSSIKEGVRFFAELYKLGAPLQYLDVGGGLGVNYDGASKSFGTLNYTEQEYANDVIHIVNSVCNEQSVPHPDIVTESGRSLTAHHSLLITDVLGSNEFLKTKNSPDYEVSSEDHQLLRDLEDISKNLNLENLVESYHDLQQIKKDTLQLFTHGVLNLSQRAFAEKKTLNLASRMHDISADKDEYSELHNHLDEWLTDTYFCNFSIFQSLPDSWAMDQVFPVLPLHRHTEKPERRAIIVDLTCDSDGKINQFIDPNSDTPKSYLEVHQIIDDATPYLMGIFLTGAYQEILGDMHNLFGDTDAVHITLKDSGFKIDHVVAGDSVSDVLRYVQYKPKELLEDFRRDCEMAIENKILKPTQARKLIQHFSDALYGYTYLN